MTDSSKYIRQDVWYELDGLDQTDMNLFYSELVARASEKLRDDEANDKHPEEVDDDETKMLLLGVLKTIELKIGEKDEKTIDMWERLLNHDNVQVRGQALISLALAEEHGNIGKYYPPLLRREVEPIPSVEEMQVEANS